MQDRYLKQGVQAARLQTVAPGARQLLGLLQPSMNSICRGWRLSTLAVKRGGWSTELSVWTWMLLLPIQYGDASTHHFSACKSVESLTSSSHTITSIPRRTFTCGDIYVSVVRNHQMRLSAEVHISLYVILGFLFFPYLFVPLYHFQRNSIASTLFNHMGCSVCSLINICTQ